MDPGKIFQVITNSTLLATRLLTPAGDDIFRKKEETDPSVQFPTRKYCGVIPENLPVSSDVASFAASHRRGSEVRYSISGGNEEGLFSIDSKSGRLTLSAMLDYEIRRKHELRVSAEVGDEVAHVDVLLTVADVNDNPPTFISPRRVNVIEEDDRDLPTTLIKIEVEDKDDVDREGGLFYSLRGDGVDGLPPEDAFFAINPNSGEILQLRALDRDPPDGRSIWKIKVRVRDGQPLWGRPPLSPSGRHPRRTLSKDQQGKAETRKNERGEDTCTPLNIPLSGQGPEESEGRVHEAETTVTVVVKDINDSFPIFTNQTMFAEVQENGPVDLSITTITALDADDDSEGSNARLTYTIEKNAVEERSGEVLFRVEPRTGVVRTSRCCLDRETTPEYSIQVVASDGGGLKGTGTVVIRLVDVNDNSPRLNHRQYHLEINETFGKQEPDNATILELLAADRDTSNYFLYRVVEGSGWGWQHFGVRTVGAAGQVFARDALDYEDEGHRKGFKFMVQVTDRGRGGWDNPRHLDSGWVSVSLKDLNDNAPEFLSPSAHVTVREDAPTGTSIASLPARDADEAGEQKVEYLLNSERSVLTIDDTGTVTLSGSLDRESTTEGVLLVEILAVDFGVPQMTSTATLTIAITDVNDCPPTLIPPTTFHVREHAPTPVILATLTANDKDVWAMGHGPPFTFSLAPGNSGHVLNMINLTFNPLLDSGRGGAEVWLTKSVDREEHPLLEVGVVVGDAGGLTTTCIVTIVVDDVNDNPMKAASKTVYLWKTQDTGSDAPLGRVYVEDLDDWDLGDKAFQWAGPPHPLFSLDTTTGTIFASSQLREGRYSLSFAVSDTIWRQRGVAANVTVEVRLLSPDALENAVRIVLQPSAPTELTKGWTPERLGGGLGNLTRAVQEVVGETTHSVEIVSVYACQGDKVSRPTNPTSLSQQQVPATCVWVGVREKNEKIFMDPVKLQGILGLHIHKVEAATSLQVNVAGESTDEDGERRFADHHSVSSLASTTLPLQVVDTNATSLVTPRLTRHHPCYSLRDQTPQPLGCTPTTCLNGGRCVRFYDGDRCVCPAGANGPHCKVFARTFTGTGWAWLPPLPPCTPLALSLRLLLDPKPRDALILYSGPLAPSPRDKVPTTQPASMLAVQVVRGGRRLQVVVEGGEGGRAKTELSASLHDGVWHEVYIQLDKKGVGLMLDQCREEWEEVGTGPSRPCLVRTPWTRSEAVGDWTPKGPLQLGGLAHPPPNPRDHGWIHAPISNPFEGCVSHLTVNGQVQDLGDPPDAFSSMGGCIQQEEACPGGCGHRGSCVGGVKNSKCVCELGWTGPRCATPTIPVSFGSSSYMKVALSFSPRLSALSVQLRLRVRGLRDGLVVRLAAQHPQTALSIQLRAGIICASVTGSGWAVQEVCVEGRPIGDGIWHAILVERYAHNLRLSIDGGDGTALRNYSVGSFALLSQESFRAKQRRAFQSPLPLPINVDKHNGVTVGGWPQFEGGKLLRVRQDLSYSCVDDLRISERPLPLPPAVNGSRWGQVTTSRHLSLDCTADADGCRSTSCEPPLACTVLWGQQPSCSCGPGRIQVGRTCESVNECIWQPCLHGGTCYDFHAGFKCVCDPGHTGDHCQWPDVVLQGDLYSHPGIVTAFSFTILLMVLLISILSRHLLRRLGKGRARNASEEDTRGHRLEERVDNKSREDTYLEERRKDVDHTAKVQDDAEGPSFKAVPVNVSTSSGDVLSDSGKLFITNIPDPLFAPDDLRAYAYEGEGSSSGSLSSATLGLQEVLNRDEGNLKPLVPQLLEAMDLLKNLPEGSRSPFPLRQSLKKEEASPDTASLRSTQKESKKSPEHAFAPRTPVSVSGSNLLRTLFQSSVFVSKKLKTTIGRLSSEEVENPPA